jgi:hypothetical protein
MTARLTDEMRKALAQQGNRFAYVEDPQTHMNYVLLPKAEYDRIRSLVEAGDNSVRVAYEAQNQVARAQGWDDPEMDIYENYDQHKKTA